MVIVRHHFYIRALVSLNGRYIFFLRGYTITFTLRATVSFSAYQIFFSRMYLAFTSLIILAVIFLLHLCLQDSIVRKYILWAMFLLILSLVSGDVI